MPLPRIVYIHGDGVLYWSWGWVARLQRELHAAGFPTFFELLPDSIEARSYYWQPFLREHVQLNEEDVILGWSCGAVAAMRCAEHQPLRGLALVAPYFTDLGWAAVRRSGWVTAPWNWPRIRAHAPSIAMFQSDNDPYIAQEEFSQLSAALEARVYNIPGAAHFGDQDVFPELTQHLLTTFGASA